MSGDIVIKVEGLGKKYLIDHQARRDAAGSVYELLARSVRGVARKRRSSGPKVPGRAAATVEELWALKDVGFEVRRGEVLGVVGRNGAGKSTLLKILSRITEPTRGRVQVRGRVASLLEVGTGFHPELTGRENIFLNGAILGMSRAEIRRKFDEIVDFAEVERFIDTPVKRYSSGMYVRLAFAVAAQLEPEILIADEVLAVGDAEFQKKCIGKLHDVAEHGRTVLFVSHNMAAVEKLCTKALLLESGQVRCSGTVRSVLSEYLASSSAAVLECLPESDSTRIAEVKSIALCDRNGVALREITAADTPHLRIQLLVRKPQADLKIACSVHDSLQNAIFSTSPPDDGVEQPTQSGFHDFLVALPGPLLMPQRYSVTVSVYTGRGESIHNCEGALTFDVLPAASRVYSVEPKRVGVLQVHCGWKHLLHQDESRRLEPEVSSAV